MSVVYRGKNASKACLYVALDALLGSAWDNEGRMFCRGIIEECNGYDSKYTRIIEEFAPVRVWYKKWSIAYSQGNRYATIWYEHRRYHIPYATPTIFLYQRGDYTGHATLLPFYSYTELPKDTAWLAFITAKNIPLLVY